METKICPICEKSFEKYYSKFCSYQCYWQSKKGKIGYWKGKNRSENTKNKIRKTLTGKFVLEKSPSWKGGLRKDRGYIEVKCPNHPAANKSGYVRQHRIIMEKAIGRCLLYGEKIHHIDGNRSNNHIDNLKLYSSHSEHMKNCHIIRFRNPNNSFEYRQCSKCKNIFKLEHENFTKNINRSLGFSHICKKCRHKFNI